MNMKAKTFVLVMMIVMSFLIFNACTFDIKENITDPTPQFKDAMAKIKTIQAKDPMRKGKVNNLNLLVYVGEEKQLITLSIPVDAAKTFMENPNINLGDEKKDKTFSKAMKDVDLKNFKNLEKMGPGLITDIQVSDDNVHVLGWLD